MDIIEQLEYKYKINQALNKGLSFDDIFSTNYSLPLNLHNFINSRIGKIWLKSKNGQQYVKWQLS